MGQTQSLLVLLSCFWLLGCTAPDPLDSRAKAPGWQLQGITANGFMLATMQPLTATAGDALHIYLGGDGRPWQEESPSKDPTGRGTLVLDLLASDPAPSVYLGRPCYHQPSPPGMCTASVWTSERYSRDVVDALTSAARSLLARYQPSELTLIGYSGGGVLAILMGAELAREGRTVTVVTLAANLDTSAWTDFHGHLPLSGSINPATTELPGAGLRLVHWHGADDVVVPPATLAGYAAAHPNSRIEYLPGCGHSSCWRDRWPALLAASLED